MGMPFKRIANLSSEDLNDMLSSNLLEEIVNEKDLGRLTPNTDNTDRAPFREFYNSESNIYPKRVAIIDLNL